jgi:hypothetical protein
MIEVDAPYQATPVMLTMLSNLAPPRLAESRCPRFGHVDPLPHGPVPDKLPIDPRQDARSRSGSRVLRSMRVT